MDDLQFALDLADVADAISTDRYLALDLVVETKPDMTPVTDADRAVEQALRERIARQRPNDTILGEEYGGERRGHGRQWVLDPIDGTANFVRHVPVWATLIGLVVDGEPVLGVASAPLLNRRWWSDGTTAWVSELGTTRTLKVSDVRELHDASLSLNSIHYWDEAGYRDAFVDLSLQGWRDRAYGDFWSYMLLAEGAIDITGECGLHPYDLAALAPIIRAAGGRLSDFDGADTIWSPNVIATNGRLHAATLSALDGTPSK